jgi:predicted metal-dependent hydrolase
MTTEVVQGKGFEAEVIRTGRRKTAAIKVEEGRVCVLVPNSAPTTKVEELVTKKTRWIREKLLLQRNFQAPKRKEYVSGECFTYLGRNYRLRVESGPSGRVGLKNGRLVVHIPPSVQKQDHYIRNALTAWYRECAQEKLQEKVDRYAKIVRVTPASVGIKTFKSRWGSCSNNQQNATILPYLKRTTIGRNIGCEIEIKNVGTLTFPLESDVVQSIINCA